MALVAWAVNAGGFLATLAMTLGISFGIDQRGPDPNTYTEVSLVIGVSSSQSNGKTPSITLYNNYGELVSRWSAWLDDGTKDLVAGGTYPFNVFHGKGLDLTRWWPPKHGTTAGYLLLSASTDLGCEGQWDGVCISAVQVKDPQSTTIILGDMPSTCGAAWYYGGQSVSAQDTEYLPRCFWIDWDGSAGITTRSISFHLQSMKGSSDRANQMRINGTDRLCKSTPTFAWWPNLKPFSWIPFFDPPLEFWPDQTYGDPDINSTDPRRPIGGAFGLDKDYWRTIDEEGQYDRTVERYMPPGVKDPYEVEGYHVGDEWAQNTWCFEKRRHNPRPRPHRLIVSPRPEHSGRELCESETSRGPDFVSKHERIFCDMDTKTAFPLCDDELDVKTGCFRLETHTLVLGNGAEVWQNVGNGTHGKRAVVPKVYESPEYW